MNLKRLKDIIDWMARSPLVELEISDGDFKVHLTKAPGGAVSASPEVEAAVGWEVVATTYGVVHLSPTPGGKPFVRVGQTVAAGQSLCVIEAMKVISPIEADRAGIIAAILVVDGAEVTAGQPLIRLE